MASSREHWRRRVEQGLARTPQEADARRLLLASVVGKPSPELERMLAVPVREAAVLLGLIERPDGLRVLLTERARHLPHHPGQVSLPGGRLEAGEDAVLAALREADEEVGLRSAQVEVIGILGPQLTGTGFSVTPVIGWVAGDFVARPDPAEVESAFEVPVAHLLAPTHRRATTRERWGTQFVSHEFLYDRYRIWGATAAIIARFIEVIDEKSI